MNLHTRTPPAALSDGRIVVIGGSAGGIQALQAVISELPVGFPAPIVVVQHRTPTHQSLLAHILGTRSSLRVIEAVEGDQLRPGVVYIARPDRHLTINGYGYLTYSDGSRIRYVLSSANPLFESAAAVFGAGAIGVVLSGYGMNGTDGVQAIKTHGGIVIAQNQETSEQFGMPGSAIRAGAVDYVLPISELAAMLIRLVTPSPQGADQT